jgi:hypothetical protein
MKERELLSSKTFGTRIGGRFAGRKTNTGKRYAGVGLRSDRVPDEHPHVTGPDAERRDEQAAQPLFGEKVTGRVTGRECEITENEVFPLDKALTRKNTHLPVTTRHSVTSHFSPCRGGCGMQVPYGQKCSDCAARSVREWSER